MTPRCKRRAVLGTPGVRLIPCEPIRRRRTPRGLLHTIGMKRLARGSPLDGREPYTLDRLLREGNEYSLLPLGGGRSAARAVAGVRNWGRCRVPVGSDHSVGCGAHRSPAGRPSLPACACVRPGRFHRHAAPQHFAGSVPSWSRGCRHHPHPRSRVGSPRWRPACAVIGSQPRLIASVCTRTHPPHLWPRPVPGA